MNPGNDHTAFREYIEHKKVVFVGACPNLLGKKMGEKIDSYDVVVRSNNFWRPMNDDLIPDYGKRCDVLYVNNQYLRETQPFPTAEMKVKGIKWICFKGCNPVKLKIYNSVISSRTYSKIIPEVSKVLPSATAGLYLAIDLLNQNPDELYYTGVDFFASRKPVFEHNNYQEYLPGYLPDNIREQGNKINAGKTKDGHDFFGNATYFYKLFQENVNFKSDDFILDLLYGIANGKIKQGEIKWQ